MAEFSHPRGLDHSSQASHEIELPASTAWPIVLAFGCTLMFAGLLTSVSVSALGLILGIAGSVGWFREVFPHEHEEPVTVVFEESAIATQRAHLDRVDIAPELARAWLPLKTYPISAGVKGGIVGGIAMAILACTYGLLQTGSIWYPINLLAATVYSQSLAMGPSQLTAFHSGRFAIAVLLHGIGSVFVGLLYGAMLPMIPRRPIVLGGLIGPVLWSGLLYSTIELLDPLLAKYINWYWFIASQIAFGVVAGLVVLRQHPVPTDENVPFAIRAGIEAPGTVPLRKDED